MYVHIHMCVCVYIYIYIYIYNMYYNVIGVVDVLADVRWRPDGQEAQRAEAPVSLSL